MAMSDWLWLIAINVLVIVVLSVLVGVLAPRWPVSWLKADRFPLTALPFETHHHYRKLRVATLRAQLPELGGLFGGASKSSLPGTDLASLDRYLVEVRRAEWVHILSCLTPLPLFFFNPWWLALAFFVVALLVNGLFLIVLRHNRLRLLQVRAIQERRLRDR
jgi:glycosyl-4,4'-diaponeurosporenoate acyltransferase